MSDRRRDDAQTPARVDEEAVAAPWQTAGVVRLDGSRMPPEEVARLVAQARAEVMDLFATGPT